MDKQTNRGTWSSSLMFLLAAIGSSVGLGNLWGFPYKMGANGGVYFLLIYLAMVILCGVVVTCVEMCIGRSTNRSPIYAIGTLAKKWKIVGGFGVFSATVITGFYAVILSYAFRYLFGFIAQIFGGDGFGGLGGGDFFVSFTQHPGSVLLYTLLTFAICSLFVAFGTKGLEKFNSVGVPALFVILIAIIIYNLTLPGSLDGYRFMFTTRGLEIAGTDFNFFNTVRAAGGQMLFSLSLGMGIMITYGSYLPQQENITKNAFLVPLFDTIAALFAGMAIFPAVFATGENVAAGPGLLYITMHNVFSNMGYIGNIVGALFYLLVVFAGVSSVISLMEVTSSSFVDRRISKGKSPDRRKNTLLAAGIMFLLSIPICLDQLGLAGENGFFWPLYSFLAEGSKDLLDLYDLVTEGLLLPVASILMCILVGWKLKMPWFEGEMGRGGAKIYAKRFFAISVRYITPVLMVFVFVSLFLSYFGI